MGQIQAQSPKPNKEKLKSLLCPSLRPPPKARAGSSEAILAGFGFRYDGVAVGGEKDHAAADDGAASGVALADAVAVAIAVFVGGRDEHVRARRQEDKAWEAVQGFVRQLPAEEEAEDRADQGPDRGPQVHPLAPPLQAHLT